MKIKKDSEKAGLNSVFRKLRKTVASGPITSWQIDGQTVETVADFILGGSKITVDDDCSHEIKRHLLLIRKAILKEISPEYSLERLMLKLKLQYLGT